MELIIGESPAIRQIKELISQVVNTDLSVLICGESGVGKELVARTLHVKSHRRPNPLVKVNCAALPGELLESELFGHEKGAFTGATQSKPGKFELANKGTIFLDEIGDMSIGLQAKLLQVLQDGVFCRVGAINDICVDTWVLAATNQDLDLAVKKGTFREDLFYRLNIIKIDVPPLRDRKEDIPVLVEHFLRKHGSIARSGGVGITPALYEIFYQYYWPGNVRELENYVRRVMVLGDADMLIRELEQKIKSGPDECVVSDQWKSDEVLVDSIIEELGEQFKDNFPSLKEVRKRALARIEKVVIEEALKRTGGNKKRAAGLLKISYKALLYKMRDFGVEMPEDRVNSESLEVKLPGDLEPFA